MAGRSRLPPTASSSSSGDPAAGGQEPCSPREESNPFSFKEFVRSQSQKAGAAVTRDVKSGGVSLELGSGSDASPKEPSPFAFLPDDSSFYPDASRLSLDFREPFFPDPTATSSLLADDDEEEDDEEDDWSSSYQPSAVEEALSARTPQDSPSDASDSFYGGPSDPSGLPWQLGRTGSLPVGEGGRSPSLNGTAGGDGFFPPLQPSYEELRRENSRLRSKIGRIQAVSETQAERVKQLERTLEENKRKEAKEARDLEAMVQQVEENLQLMTKRALKAESGVVKLRQENALLQAQVESCRLENEALKSGHVANRAAAKHNTEVALQKLLAVVAKSRASLKQLLSGAEELQVVAELLKSVDKMSELPRDAP